MIMPDIYSNVQTHFDQVRVPKEQVIGEINKGHRLLEDMLGTKLLPFSSTVGYSRNLYEQMVMYAKERVQGGKPIIEHSHIARMLGELGIYLESTRHFFFKAAYEIDEREKAGAERNNFWSLACFYMAKKLALMLAEAGNEIYGGLSATIELPLGRWIQHTYTFLAGGGPPGMDAIECSTWYNKHTLGEPWKKK
jgi:alkylation response protein AidB-like acyl-CoA dehydrogenase